MNVSCFPPLFTPSARVLVLGSMPGTASLAANQYYAHGRNIFWPLLCDIYGAPPILSYTDKIALLATHHIAVWDVLAQCHRPGSLDTDITKEEPNNFEEFFRRCPDIQHIFFNGKKAETSFRKFVWPILSSDLQARLTLHLLPSTSPANAGVTYAEKRQAWQALSRFSAPN